MTGCSSGFGLLTALVFAKHGHHVVASMRDTAKAGPLRDAAATAGVDVEVVELDVSSSTSVGYQLELRDGYALRGLCAALLRRAPTFGPTYPRIAVA